jgi:energy-coupling factor transporter ATP-binding protein EcfA2
MKKILILASNPNQDLRIDREIRDLKKAVKRSSSQEQFEVEIELAIRPGDLQELFQEYKPYIVHFCGHGTGEKGLVFENQTGGEQLVSNQALSSLFRIFGNDVNCVLLNACHTEVQADAIVEHIQYVIGTSREILDEAAYFFAVGFYRGLGYGEAIKRCYELGCNAIELQMPNVTILPHISERYRKLEVVDSSESVAASEPLKIVLKKNSLLPSPPEKNIPADFIEVIKEEGKRKQYNNTTRKTWDEFGQTDRFQPLNQQEYRQRQILVNKVNEFWIEGFLKPSLYADTAINLNLKNRPDAVSPLFEAIAELPVELDKSFEELQQTEIFDQIGQGKTLLILGEPGSGKTIALLQLAQRIIERTERDLSQPIPVVLNLSSWAKKGQKIEAWLIEELREKYGVPKSLSKPWIEQGKLVLLLDGLDEVQAERRNSCVRALNQFIARHSMTDIVICSRVKDYEALTERLQLSSAICLQPLSSEQVNDFLEKAGDSLVGLKTLLQQDAELEKFAETPLIFNIMSLAYQGVSAEDLLPQFRSTEDRYQTLWNAYIERMLRRKGALAKYPKEKVKYWLSWLAKQMIQESRTVFFIEKMQPSWLQNRGERIVYLASLLLLGWLIGNLSVSLKEGGLFFVNPLEVLNLLVLYPFLIKIKPVEQISWSWSRAKSGFIFGFILGFIFGFILSFVAGLEFRAEERNIILIGGFIFGLFGGLFPGLYKGLIVSELEQKRSPNQGIKNSAKSFVMIMLMVNFVLFFFVSLSILFLSIEWSALTSGEMLKELVRLREEVLSQAFLRTMLYDNWELWLSGPIFGLVYGGGACIQHFNLRLILYKKDRIPWNYARFLDYASERLLMKKVGGGYVFYHRMLMEHFARIEPD